MGGERGRIEREREGVSGGSLIVGYQFISRC